MAIKTVMLALVIEDEAPPAGVIDYALAFCDAERAHLSCRMIAPLTDLPTGRLVPLAQAIIDEVNGERLKRAKDAAERLSAAAAVSGVPTDVQPVQEHYSVARADLITVSRFSDVVVLPQSMGVLSFEAGLVEGVLFGSGRPVIVVPSEWSGPCQFKRIVVAWDGSARAARAVGDALPLLERAEEVEVVCVVDQEAKSVAGSELSEHLSRHCRRVRLTDLPIQHDDDGWTLRDHIDYVKPDLLVMGAYAHPRFFQYIIGGVTSMMLKNASVPVLYSY